MHGLIEGSLEDGVRIALGGSAETERGHDYDFRSADGRHVFEVKAAIHGARDLREALLRLGLAAAADPDVARAVLIALFPSMGGDRIRDEWRALQGVVKRSVLSRLGIVGLASDGACVVPDDADLKSIATVVLSTLRDRAAGYPLGRKASRPSLKFFTVYAVLLDSWIRRESPLAVHDLAQRARCSHPTAAAALTKMQQRGEVETTSQRRPVLTGFPSRSFHEAVVLDPTLRRPRAFVDRTRRPDPEALLRRLGRLRPPGLALGGVAAARAYDPDFDLVGLPRVDLLRTHAGFSRIDGIDPALADGSSPGRADPAAPVLVVRQPLSPEEPRPGPDLPLGAPIDTLLDLYDLRLTDQAATLVRRMRAAGS